MLNFIVDCSSSVFGTCFVTFNTENYKHFVSSYDLSNIYEVNVFSTLNTGFNSIFVSPQNLEFTKSYKKIVFLDSIVDETYIAKINSISDAKIFLPKNAKQNKKIFNTLNFDRKFARNIYCSLINHENTKCASILSIYSKIVKENNLRISFNNFLFYFLVFSELNIIKNIDIEGFFGFEINKEIKTELKNSSIYNMCKLINKIS